MTAKATEVMQPLGKIRVASAADMAIIEEWLREFPNAETLAPNWNLTMDAFREGEVFVFDDAHSGIPVAYCWGSLNSHDSVLEVHPGYRGKGVGRAMAQFMIQRCVDDGEPLLEFGIAPVSAEEFWKRMGFSTSWDRNHGRVGRRKLELLHPVPAGERHLVRVAFLPECAAWGEDATPLAQYEVIGVQPPGESKVVVDRTLAHYELPEGDLVIQISVDEQQLFLDKAKRPEAAALGVRRCKNGFCIVEVCIGDAAAHSEREWTD